MNRALRYALGLWVEEMGECLKLIGKALRFGLDTPGPIGGEYEGMTARQLLQGEGGDLAAALEYAARAGILDPAQVKDARDMKLAKLTNPESKDNLGRRLAPDPEDARRGQQ